MKKGELEKAILELPQNQKKMRQQLLDFFDTDLLFFFSDKPELYLRQKQEWQPILDWIEELWLIKPNFTQSLDVPDNTKLKDKLPMMFDKMNSKEFCCWYAASLNLRSILLGLALVLRKIDAKQAANLAAIEEIWQNEQWGEDKEAWATRQARDDELREIESFLLCAM